MCIHIWKDETGGVFCTFDKFMAVWSFLKWHFIAISAEQTDDTSRLETARRLLPPVMVNKWCPMGRHTFSRLFLQFPYGQHIYLGYTFLWKLCLICSPAVEKYSPDGVAVAMWKICLEKSVSHGIFKKQVLLQVEWNTISWVILQCTKIVVMHFFALLSK